MAERDHTDLRDAAEGLMRALDEGPARENQVKQVIVYRRDLKMRKGKIAAQVAHASMKVLLDMKTPRDDLERMGLGPADLLIPMPPDVAAWVDGIFTKIVLTVDSEENLLLVHALARKAGIPHALVTDAGRTEFREKCPDCGGFGFLHPAPGCVTAPRCGTCDGTGKIGVPTRTCVAVGPARASVIDEITGVDGAVPTRLP